MTQLKHTINFLLVLCLIFLGLSYVISVNKEIMLIYINSVWISNEFLYTCCSGVSASIFVLIVTEVYKFFQTKRNVENYLFTQLLYLYEQLHIADTNIRYQLSQRNEISGALLDYLTHSIQMIAPQLRTIDYNPFFMFKRSRIIKSLVNDILSYSISDLEKIANECTYLRIAIITDKMDSYKIGIHNPIITTTCPNTNKTLIIIKNRIGPCKSKLHSYISKINTACCNRFHWDDIEQRLLKVNIPDTSLEAFWDRYKQYTEQNNNIHPN